MERTGCVTALRQRDVRGTWEKIKTAAGVRLTRGKAAWRLQGVTGPECFTHVRVR